MFWGLLFGILFFVPILGIAMGAGFGALFGKIQESGISKEFISQVRGQSTRDLGAVHGRREGDPRQGDRGAQEYGGTVIKSSLSKETEQRSKRLCTATKA